MKKRSFSPLGKIQGKMGKWLSSHYESPAYEKSQPAGIIHHSILVPSWNESC
jgi:hypothetical protein